MHPRSRLPALLSGGQVNQLIMQSMSYSNSVDADASLLHLLHMLEHYFYLSQTVSDPTVSSPGHALGEGCHMGGLCSVHIIHFAQKHRYFQKLEEHGHHGSAPVNMDADQVFMNQPTLQIMTLASSCTYRAKTLQITGVVVYLSSQFLHRSSRFAQALRGGDWGRESGRLTEELVSRPARIRVQIHTPKGSIEPPCIADPRRACSSASTPSQPTHRVDADSDSREYIPTADLPFYCFPNPPVPLHVVSPVFPRCTGVCVFVPCGTILRGSHPSGWSRSEALRVV